MPTVDEELDEIRRKYSGADAGQQATGETGTYYPQGMPGHILKVLGYLDRPRNAVASGVAALQNDKPDGFLEGAYEGFMGNRETPWGDVLGMLPTTKDDTWLEYLAKGAPRLAADMLIDPLNFAGGAGMVRGAVSATAKKIIPAVVRNAAYDAAKGAGHYVAGSGFGKAFMHGVPLEDGFNQDISKIYAGDAAVKREVADAAAQARDTLRKEMPPMGNEEEAAAWLARVRETVERPDIKMLGVTPEASKATDPLAAIDRRIFDEENAFRFGLDMDLVKPVEDIGFVPRLKTDAARALIKQQNKRNAVQFDPTNPQSRTIHQLTDPTGTWKAGKAVTTATDPKNLKRLGLTRDADGNILANGDTLLQTSSASLMDINQAKIMPKGSFIEDPVTSFVGDIQKKAGRVNFLRAVEGMVGKHIDHVDTIAAKGGMPSGWRTLKVSGLEHYAAPKWAANQLENASQLFHDPDTYLGGIEKTLQAWRNGPLGGVLNKLTTMWKRGVLAWHPGYIAGNVISNAVLMSMGNLKNPMRIGQALKVQFGKGKPMFSNMDNLTLGRQLEDRGLMSSDFFGSETMDEVSKAGKTYVTGKLGKGIEKFNDIGLRFSSLFEDNAKVALALDYLMKHAPKGKSDVKRIVKYDEFGNKTVIETAPKAQGKARQEITPDLLDRAAHHAQDYLFNYNQLTPLERELKQFIPFYTWHRKMMGRFLKDTVKDPAGLANVGRAWDFTFTPPSEREGMGLPPWMQTGGPAMGWLGGQARTSSGEPGMFQTGRFNPYGTPEDLLRKGIPDYLASNAAPWMKALYELAANKNTSQGGRPIDPLAGDHTLSAFTNPITGGDYTPSPNKTFGVHLPKAYEYALGLTPFSRHLNEANTLLGRGALYGGDKPDMDAKEKAIWYATGGKVFPRDIEKEKHQIKTKNRAGISAARSEAKRAQAVAAKTGNPADIERWKHIQRILNEREKTAASRVY